MDIFRGALMLPLLILLGAWIATAAGQEKPDVAPTPSIAAPGNPWRRSPEQMHEIKLSVDRGLSYLARMQEKQLDGSLPREDAQQYAPVGVTALAALAFLGGGHASHGAYSDNAFRAVDYLISQCDLSDSTTRGYIRADNDAHSNMHGQGYATLALAEIYGMYGTKRGKGGETRLKECLGAAIQLIQQSQGESGGWYYTPFRNISHEGSVTITLVQALRAGRNAGFQVDKGVIDRAIEYIRKLQKEDGSFRYQLGREESTAALTAAAVATLNATGLYEGPEINRGMDFLLRREEQSLLPRLQRIREPFPDYRRLYTAQAFYQYKDPSLWSEWFAKTQQQLLGEQREDGSWKGRTEFGSIYTTAVNCLVLEISFDYLPIFQR